MVGFWRKVLCVTLLCGCSGEPELDTFRSALSRPRPVDIDRHGLPRAPKRLGAPIMEYFGGPVISNPKVYVVWWGDPSGLDSAITSDGGAVDFFTGVTNSNFIDWLNEYDTNITVQAGTATGDAGTQQRIGRGNFVKAVALQSPPMGSIQDSDVQSTLNQAFASGTLPPPDGNTIYSIFFPASVTINLGGPSCFAFGGYHEAIIEASGPNAYYLVIPDCGNGSDTIVDSHELVEATTDPIPTPGSNPDYPQAWNDSMGSEVGDRCETGGVGTVDTTVGQFTVQTIWDEKSQGCVTFRSDSQDFNVLFPTNFATVTRGIAQVFTVQTSTVAGASQTLTLSTSAPPGVTATLSTTSVTSGQPATVTVVAGHPLISDALQVVVRADGMNGGTTVVTHTASLLIDVIAPDGGTDAGSPPDAGGVVDAGTTPDAGTARDAGTSQDAGAATDAGSSADAGSGTPDAGTVPDAGNAPDAGEVADAGSNTPDAGSEADAGFSADSGSPVPDAGNAEPDAGASSPDAGSGGGGASGCGCSTEPAGKSAFEWLAGLAGLAWVRFRRREC
jgi:MYXO-CTERM domain-containing protein